MVSDMYCEGKLLQVQVNMVFQWGGQRVRVTFTWWAGLGRAPDSRPFGQME